MSTPTSYKEFELPGGSYPLLDIQEYFNYIIKKHETVSDNSLIRIQLNKTQNRVHLE